MTPTESCIEVARIEARFCRRPYRSRKPDLLAPLAVEIPALVCVWLRLYARWTTSHKLEADDWVILICAVSSSSLALLERARAVVDQR